MSENEGSFFHFSQHNSLRRWRDFLLSSGAEMNEYIAGTQFCSQSEECASVYFVLRGLVKAYLGSSGVSGRLLGYYKSDTLFGLGSLTSKGTSPVSLQSVTPVTALRIAPDRLERLCRENAAFATDLMLYVVQDAQAVGWGGETAATEDVNTRLANFLCLYLQSAVLPGSTPYVHFTQQALAEAICASHIQTTKACAQLRDAGLISLGRKRIAVQDYHALYALCR